MSVHDQHNNYNPSHPTSPRVRGYRMGCILDWLASVAGWGKQVRVIPACPVPLCSDEQHITTDWHRIALGWQHTQTGNGNVVGCTVAGCDGVT